MRPVLSVATLERSAEGHSAPLPLPLLSLSSCFFRPCICIIHAACEPANTRNKTTTHRQEKRSTQTNGVQTNRRTNRRWEGSVVGMGRVRCTSAGGDLHEKGIVSLMVRRRTERERRRRRSELAAPVAATDEQIATRIGGE